MIIIPAKTEAQQKFYNSKKWRKLSEVYKDYKDNKCERCGNDVELSKIVHHKIHLDDTNINDANITMNFDNLELVCRTCHNQEHFAKQPSAESKFDCDGDLIEFQHIPPI